MNLNELLKNRWPIPAGEREVRCKSCGAAMVWGTTSRGKVIPLSVASAIEVDGERWAFPHFVDCPNAKQHKKGA